MGSDAKVYVCFAADNKIVSGWAEGRCFRTITPQEESNVVSMVSNTQPVFVEQGAELPRAQGRFVESDVSDENVGTEGQPELPEAPEEDDVQPDDEENKADGEQTEFDGRTSLQRG